MCPKQQNKVYFTIFLHLPIILLWKNAASEALCDMKTILANAKGEMQRVYQPALFKSRKLFY